MNINYLPHWAESSQQRPIELYHSPHLRWQKGQSPVVLIGGVHGDEPEGVWLASATLKWLKAQNYSTFKTPWILIPCLNPDGYAENKRTNGNGVDLNRNYPSKNWSPHSAEPRYFPGHSPGSEPEIIAITKLMHELAPGLMIHFHSWQPCVIATGHKAVPFASQLSDSSGYELKEHIGYDTPGSLSQYGWHDHQIPIICIEEQEHLKQDTTWEHFGPGLVHILKNYP